MLQVRRVAAWVGASAIVLGGCHSGVGLLSGQLVVVAPDSVEVSVLRKGKGSKAQGAPLSAVLLLRGGASASLDPGEWTLATECSSVEVKVQTRGETRVELRELAIDPGPLPADAASVRVIPAVCADPVDGHVREWSDRRSFHLLPGRSTLTIGGRLFQPDAPSPVAVHPVAVIGPEVVHTQVRYFTIPSELDVPDGVRPTGGGRITGTLVGETVMLPKGAYTLEVNGSKRAIEVPVPGGRPIALGAVRIEAPADFPMTERLRAGGQPIFGFINEGVLFNLNSDYLVFPGSYNVRLEGSDVRKMVQVEPQARVVLNASAARIVAPPCNEETRLCRSPARITVHEERKPFSLMTVDAGLPFLVFDSPYQYGVEGIRGVLRTLSASRAGLASETLARVKFDWEIREANGRTRTDLVRFESKGTVNFGRSLDLLFSKPDELFVPAGTYQLTYFVGDPSQERPKTRVDVSLQQGETRVLTVPLYIDKLSLRENAAPGASPTPAADAARDGAPASLKPLRNRR